MKRVAARVSAGAIVLALALPALARAPSDQYGVYGASDVIITDAKTGLIWQRGHAPAASWSAASTYCSGLALGGANGWRLPSIKELATLVDESIEEEYVPGVGIVPYAIDRSAFPDTPSGAFWAWPNAAPQWSVHFDDGHVAQDNAAAFVRCVR